MLEGEAVCRRRGNRRARARLRRPGRQTVATRPSCSASANEHVNALHVDRHPQPEGILTLHMLDSLSIAPDLLDAATVLDGWYGRRLSGPAARGRVPAAWSSCSSTVVAEEDPLRERRHRGAGHHQCESDRRSAPRNSTSPNSTPSSCAQSAPSPTYYITPVTLVAPEGRLIAIEGQAPGRRAGGRTARLESENLQRCACRASTRNGMSSP